MISAFPMEQQNAAMMPASSKFEFVVIFMFLGLIGMKLFFPIYGNNAMTIGNPVQMDVWRASTLDQLTFRPKGRPVGRNFLASPMYVMQFGLIKLQSSKLPLNTLK